LTIQASLEVIQLLEKLFAIWTEWEKNEHYYIHTLLPELQTNHENGSHEVKNHLTENTKNIYKGRMGTAGNQLRVN